MFRLYTIKSYSFWYCVYAMDTSAFWLASVTFGDPACQKVTVVLFCDGYVNVRSWVYKNNRWNSESYRKDLLKKENEV